MLKISLYLFCFLLFSYELTENVEKTIVILLVVFQKIYLVGKLTFGDLYYLHTNYLKLTFIF